MSDISIFEVGPRDGLQNERTPLSTEFKVELINLLSQTGLQYIESTSFVSPGKIPQLSDGQQVMRNIQRKDNIKYPVLIPNITGLENAIACGIKDICVFTSASEQFCQKNINCSVSESLQRIQVVCEQAKQQNISVRGYVSCVFGCPYEGQVEFKKTQIVANTLLEYGCYEISLGDTIGVATPGDIKASLSQLSDNQHYALHLHDTYGQALANIYCALDQDITTFDASIAGLGGCPYAAGATGNVATEDLIYMLDGLGIKTGVNLKALLSVSKFIRDQLPQSVRSKVAQALLD